MSALRTTTTCTGCGNEIPESLLDDALCCACRYSSTKKPVENLDGDGSPVPTEYEIAADKFAFDAFADASEPTPAGDGQRAPIIEATATDSAPHLDARQLLETILHGARDKHEIAAFAAICGNLMGCPSAPRTSTEFAALLDIPRSTGQRLWARLFEYLQGELKVFGHGHALVDERNKFNANADGAKSAG
jgi:hypothetical protein